jgi:glycosyltransferase involved in cell wall biosynthesis
LSVLMEGSLFSAKKIVTDSEFSLQRLKHHYPQYASKLNVVEPGLDSGFLQLLPADQKLPKSIKKPFLLCVSGLYPHKRVPYVLELWEQLQKSLPQHELVIVGKNGTDSQQVAQRAREVPRTHLLPSVSLSELVALYQNADLCVQPSVYEGFGFPVYEALAAGAPVIVGKKECFSRAVSDELSELTFSHTEDAALILRTLKKKRTVVNIGDYSKRVKKLLDLYAQV